MIRKLAEFLGREVEIWTDENPEPWLGTLREVTPSYIVLQIDELSTYIASPKIVAFREAPARDEEGDAGYEG